MRRRLAFGVLLPLLATLLFAASRANLRDPAPTVLLRDRGGVFLGEVGSADGEGFGYWEIEALPWRVVAATLALEDRRFHEHPGVDPRALARAARQNWEAGEVVSGASTIAMQVARMQDPGPRTVPRKAVEALTAMMLTGRYGREAVLAQYLRLAPYGNGIHGIAYAARRYLDKPVDDLSWAETAFLSALPQSPSLTNPFRAAGRARAVTRARRILIVLFEQGLLTMEERDLAMAEVGHLQIPDRGARPVAALHTVLRLEELVKAPGARAALGPRPLVTATLDLALQGRVLGYVRGAVEDWKDAGAGNAAVMVLDRATGEVLASVGSTGYFDPRHAGSIDYTRVRRNPGSTLKPFFYASALERGVIHPATVLDDLGRGADGVENADNLFLGPLLPRRALANSRNVPAVALLQMIGLEDGYALLRDLGLHHDEYTARHWGVGLAIGGMPLTLEQLVRAYTTLAGDGRLREPVWLRGQPEPVARRIYAEETSRRIALWLSDPMARLPSFPRMGSTEFAFPVAVKTGTSPDYRDAWAVAWSTRYLVGAWVGDPDWQPMVKLSGFTSAATLVQAVLSDLHHDESDGLADVSFPTPRGLVPARVCSLTGHLAGDACDAVVTEHFGRGEAPVETCRAHVRLTTDSRDGLLATARTPARFARTTTFVDLPARYAVWQAEAGLPRPPVGVSPLGPNDAAPVLAAPVPAAIRPFSAQTPVVRITSPENGRHLLRDLEVPADQATLSLQATVDPPVAQLVWYVDGEPYRVVEYPYATRWPLQAGEHRFEARIPFQNIGSAVVRVTGQ